MEEEAPPRTPIPMSEKVEDAKKDSENHDQELENAFYKNPSFSLSPILVLSEVVYKGYHYYYTTTKEIERAEGLNNTPLYTQNKHRLFKSILNMFTGDCAIAIFGYLRIFGASTVKELKEELGFQQQTINLALNSMKSKGLVTVRRTIQTEGRNANIWALIPAELEHLNQAEQRYRQIKHKYVRQEEDKTEQLVIPLIQEYIQRYRIEPGGQIRMDFVRDLFREKHGYYDGDVRSMIHRAVKKLGYAPAYMDI